MKLVVEGRGESFGVDEGVDDIDQVDRDHCPSLYWVSSSFEGGEEENTGILKVMKKKIQYFEATARYVGRVDRRREGIICLLLKLSDANEIAAAVHRRPPCLGFTLNI